MDASDQKSAASHGPLAPEKTLFPGNFRKHKYSVVFKPNKCKITLLGYNKNITSIPASCFEGCEYLEFIEIPRHITSIGEKAFKGCVRFERLEIRDTMKYVGEAAFDNCIRLYIVCEAKAQPDTWDKNWNPDNRDLLWGHYVVD